MDFQMWVLKIRQSSSPGSPHDFYILFSNIYDAKPNNYLSQTSYVTHIKENDDADLNDSYCDEVDDATNINNIFEDCNENEDASINICDSALENNSINFCHCPLQSLEEENISSCGLIVPHKNSPGINLDNDKSEGNSSEVLVNIRNGEVDNDQSEKDDKTVDLRNAPHKNDVWESIPDAVQQEIDQSLVVIVNKQIENTRSTINNSHNNGIVFG